ncbi:flagellar hook assembly protein FlgD [Salinibacter altiplanensis]|uniref:flagellar hook assembly protein FlgD n=1 Tax=Salinibacter altiplanensis TaxID=1803181 RepID=UPI000C9F147E|nr:flagellar hook capping FlgD N-terminal domain-containing protein [Salinibacter altiplanensis]
MIDPLGPSTETARPASADESGADGAGGLSEATSANLGKNDFLKLLTTQLKNQDPSNPMKGKEFAAQLAQFSSVEQLNNISGQIKEQGNSDGALAQSLNDSIATDLIGRRVETSGNTMQWTGEGEATFGLDLERPAAEATFTIRDAGGNAIHTETLEDVSGTTEVSWDGTTDGGARAPAGTYSVDVNATSGSGDSIQAAAQLEGTVDRVTLEDGGTSLRIGGAQVAMSRVQSIAAQ